MEKAKWLLFLLFALTVGLVFTGKVSAKNVTLSEIASAFNNSSLVKEYKGYGYEMDASASDVESNVLSVNLSTASMPGQSFSYELNGNILSYEHLTDKSIVTAYVLADTIGMLQGYEYRELARNFTMFADEVKNYTLTNQGFEVKTNGNYYSVSMDITKKVPLKDKSQFYLKPSVFDSIDSIVKNNSVGCQSGFNIELGYDVCVTEKTGEIYIGEVNKLSDRAYKSVLSALEVMYGNKVVDYFKSIYPSIKSGLSELDGFTIETDYEDKLADESVLTRTNVVYIVVDNQFVNDELLRTEYIGETVDHGDVELTINLIGNKTYRINVLEDHYDTDVYFLIKYVILNIISNSNLPEETDVYYFNIVDGAIALGDVDNSIFKVSLKDDILEITSTNQEVDRTLVVATNNGIAKEYDPYSSNEKYYRYGKYKVKTNITYGTEVNDVIKSMSNEDKIAIMIMPSFRKEPGVEINEDNIKEILSEYEYAGVILFSENTRDIESTMNFIDLLQGANKDHNSRLLIAIDQEGGYVTRLGIGTNTPGNMALAATGDSSYAYEAAQIIARELSALGINTNFAPVVDVNSNPANPVIGVRSFSDDPETVALFSEKFMEGLQSQGIITSLKHFPGHGDTSTDTHTGLTVVNKTYDELKENDLIPFQKLIDSGTDMIMTAHIQYPKVETETFVSKKDGQTYTVPATLSKTFLTDIIRNEMGFDGIIVTDAFDMKAISDNFDLVDASIRSINAGADILLMPYIYDSSKDELSAYIKTLAGKIGTEINEENVNAAVKRVLRLKETNGLFVEYDNSNLEENIEYAKEVVSSLGNHEAEFEMAKRTVTMVKNTDEVLPLNSKDKTIVLYEYDSHIKAVSNVVTMLKNENESFNGDNISVYPFYDETGALPVDVVKEQVKDAKNVILIHSLYGISGLKDPDLDKMNEIIDYVHENGGRAIVISAQLPYNVAKFTKADAILVTYLAYGVRIDLDDYTSEIPEYGNNVMAGLYMLYSDYENVEGILPVNIYKLDSSNEVTDQVLYKRGFGLSYEYADYDKLDDLMNLAEDIMDSLKEYSEESFNALSMSYNNAVDFYDNRYGFFINKQPEIDSLVQGLQTAIDNLKPIYRILDGDKQVYNGKENIVIRASGNIGDLNRLEVNRVIMDPDSYELSNGSTIATLKSSYLSTLDEGDYTLSFVYNDGSVDATFTIPKKSMSPKTGDEVIIYICVLVLSLAGLVGTIIYERKKRMD